MALPGEQQVRQFERADAASPAAVQATAPSTQKKRQRPMYRPQEHPQEARCGHRWSMGVNA